jgi:hypothetical protein
MGGMPTRPIYQPVFTLSGEALMRRSIIAAAALIVMSLAPSRAPALEIVNLRPAYGQNGAARADAKKIAMGDILWIDFTITGLKVDEKLNKVRYDTILELFDSKEKRMLERKSPNEAVLQLGGSQMPGSMNVVVGDQFQPGKYALKLTVKDNLAKKEVSVVHSFEVLPAAFGFVHIEAPALAVPGADTGMQLLVTGFTPDKKKDPNVDITIRVLDATEKPVAPPMITSFPRDLPAGTLQPQILPVVFPITNVNRPGQFYIDIVAVDKNASNKEIKLRLPLMVVDINAVASK